MELEALRRLLAWCTVFNWVVLLIWVGFLLFAADWMYSLHGKLFRLSRESFDAIHYAGVATLKVLVLVFNLVPYLVLRLMF